MKNIKISIDLTYEDVFGNEESISIEEDNLDDAVAKMEAIIQSIKNKEAHIIVEPREEELEEELNGQDEGDRTWKDYADLEHPSEESND